MEINKELLKEIMDDTERYILINILQNEDVYEIYDLDREETFMISKDKTLKYIIWLIMKREREDGERWGKAKFQEEIKNLLGF